MENFHATPVRVVDTNSCLYYPAQTSTINEGEQQTLDGVTKLARSLFSTGEISHIKDYYQYNGTRTTFRVLLSVPFILRPESGDFTDFCRFSSIEWHVILQC